MSLDSDMRRVRTLARSRMYQSPWIYDRPMRDWYPWRQAVDTTVAQVVANPAFIPHVKDSLGVQHLPTGVRQDEDECVIARATGAPFGVDWAEDPLDWCCFAVAFDAGLLPQYDDHSNDWMEL